MALSARLRLFYFLHFANPAADRLVYRTIREHLTRSILEIGIGPGERALRMIEVAALHAPVAEVRYVGVDLFEARTQRDGPGLSLKAAHSLLRATGARVNLVPGDPASALARTANLLKPADLVVISVMPAAAMSAAWFFLPRLLHPRSIVLRPKAIEGAQGAEFEQLSLAEVDALASRAKRRRAA